MLNRGLKKLKWAIAGETTFSQGIRSVTSGVLTLLANQNQSLDVRWVYPR